MSDLRTIHFNTFLLKRIDLKDDLEVNDFEKNLRTLAILMQASHSMILMSNIINEMLGILHKSAKINNDNQALMEVEILCAKALQLFKPTEGDET